MTICDKFADEGFIAVAIDYRLGYKIERARLPV